MLQLLAKRLVQAVLILFGVSAITFVLLYALPADPARMLAGRSATAKTVENIRHELGLDKPLVVQFGHYVGGLVQGDFGRSYAQKTEVSTLIAARLPATLTLMAAGIALEVLFGLVLGVIAALNRGKLVDRVIMMSSFVGVSPAVRRRAAAALCVCGHAGLVSDVGLRDSGPCGPARGHPRLAWRRLVCPHGPLGDDRCPEPGLRAHRPRQGSVARPRRAPPRAAECHTSDHRDDRDRHWSVHGRRRVVEAVYGWPGIGQLAWQAIQQVDIPIIMGVTLTSALAIILGNLLADLIAPAIDPRIRSH